MKKFIHYEEADFNEHLIKIANQLKSQKFKVDAIVGISRGGLFPAVRLSHALNIKMYAHNPGNESALDDWLDENKTTNILIIDEICDSGKTYNDLVQGMGEFATSPRNYKYAALLYNTDQAFDIDFWGHKFSRKETPEWFQFFWEKELKWMN